MIEERKIREVAKYKVKELGGYLVDVKVSHTNDITILFDTENGVTFSNCSELSKYIEDIFDKDEENYSLTVCSPGLDNAFLVTEQYKKHLGKEVKVLLKNGKRKSGKIVSYNEKLILELNKETKKNKKLQEKKK